MKKVECKKCKKIVDCEHYDSYDGFICIKCIREEFKRATIEAIHGLPWEKAKKKEVSVEGCVCEDNNGYLFVANGVSESGKKVFRKDYRYCHTSCVDIIGLPITISRVMQALDFGSCEILKTEENIIELYFEKGMVVWKLIKENGEECTDTDQSDSTIEDLLELLKS